MSTLYVIPCSGKKLTHPAPAGELYTGSWHQLARQTADAMAARRGGRTVILSAMHGLLQLTDVVEPYNLTIAELERSPRPGERDLHPGGSRALAQHVADQLLAMGTTELVLLLPTKYAHVMAAAAISVSCSLGGPTIRRWWPLEGLTGVGYQRQELARLRDATEDDQEEDSATPA